jgi:hypothetical protein
MKLSLPEQAGGRQVTKPGMLLPPGGAVQAPGELMLQEKKPVVPHGPVT